MKIYLVGGAVRDTLLGLVPKERDWVVVGSNTDEMLNLGFKQVGKDFPVFLHPDSHEEYALARTERKTGPGYTGFDFHASTEVTLEEDLMRRDLTINAIAKDDEGNLIDPYNGQQDLDSGLLRHVSPAFAEDPVRILRIARFAARFAKFGFKVAHGTNALMRKMVANGEVDALVAERVWKELDRSLAETQPNAFFKVLRGCHALAVLFPEINALFGVPQPEKHHPEVDTGVHVMMVLEQASKLSNEPRVRFAALTHDLGKGTTRKDKLPQHIGHEKRSVDLVKQLCDRYKVPNDYRALALLTAEYHTHCHRALELKPKTVLKVLDVSDAFRNPQRFEEFLLACEADACGRQGKESEAYPQADFFRAALRIAQAVDTKAIIEKGFEGKAIRDELHQQRIKAIQSLEIKHFKP